MLINTEKINNSQQKLNLTRSLTQTLTLNLTFKAHQLSFYFVAAHKTRIQTPLYVACIPSTLQTSQSAVIYCAIYSFTAQKTYLLKKEPARLGKFADFQEGPHMGRAFRRLILKILNDVKRHTRGRHTRYYKITALVFIVGVKIAKNQFRT